MSNFVLDTNSPPLTLAITPGEPAGIGPDIALLLGAVDLEARVVFVADPELLGARASRLKLSCTLHDFDRAKTGRHRGGHYHVLPVPLRATTFPGVLDPANSAYVLACLDVAIAGCLDGTFDAMVTGPVHKAVINDAGIPFSGHTEYLATAAGGVEPVMLLATPTLRVALATTHVPLMAVPPLITGARLGNVFNTVDAALRRYFGLHRPRLSVCGLNPHAGEGGHLGREELEVIEPAIALARAAGLGLRGPLPGDTAFTRDALARTDAVIAMYHDQGLAPLKALDFGEAVNVTLGLPFIRTSVDHGTALELAGSGNASPTSVQAAFNMACLMARSRRASA